MSPKFYMLPKGLAYRLVENVRKNEQKNGVQEVYHSNRDVVDVGFLVHPWPKNTDSYQKGSFHDDQRHRLYDRRGLSKGDKHRFDEDVGKQRDDEVISCCPILHIEESPFV
jgi:hypothetical protein